MYKLTKQFTSRDGKLEVDDREYGMTQEGLDAIGDAKPHLGGGTHIFVRIDGGSSNEAQLTSRDGQYNFVEREKPESGWANFNIEHGSGYAPERGESGWWSASVYGAPSDVVPGLGLPHSWHVSNFLIFTWDENGEVETPEVPGEGEPEVPEIPENPNKQLRMEFSISAVGYAAIVRLYTDGTYEMDENR